MYKWITSSEKFGRSKTEFSATSWHISHQLVICTILRSDIINYHVHINTHHNEHITTQRVVWTLSYGTVNTNSLKKLKFFVQNCQQNELCMCNFKITTLLVETNLKCNPLVKFELPRMYVQFTDIRIHEVCLLYTSRCV